MVKEGKRPGDMSVEDILKSIRGIISNHPNTNINDEEVLELTNIIKEGKKKPLIKSSSELNNLKDDSLISEKSANDTTNLFKEFADKATIAVQEGKKPKSMNMEDLVIEMMRPQLSKWLDEHLPALVGQLVEKEIKRLIPNDRVNQYD